MPWKADLRRGFRCYLITKDKRRGAVFCRASLSFAEFQWISVRKVGQILEDTELANTDKKRYLLKNMFSKKGSASIIPTVDLDTIEFDHQVKVAKLLVEKGMKTETFRTAGKALKSVKPNRCLSLLASKKTEYERGAIQLSLVFPTVEVCDIIINTKFDPIHICFQARNEIAKKLHDWKFAISC